MGQSDTRRAKLLALLFGLAVSGLLVAVSGAWWHAHYGGPEFLWTERAYYQKDELAGHLHRPGMSLDYDWDEHPTGRITLRTNNLGFREDEDTSVAKAPGVMRVLVTGDSHTDGVVNNDESFPNLVEARLNAPSREGAVIEVLNGGHGFYGPQNYAGFLRRFLFLQPDLFIVALFTGNDFLDALAYAVESGELDASVRPEGYWQKLKSLKRVDGRRYAGRSQGVNQLYLFKTRPELQERALDLTTDSFVEIAELCREHQIDLLVLLVPTLFDVEWERDAERNAVVRRTLDLSDGDLGINRRLTSRLADRLERAGIATLDLLAPMLASGRSPQFWVQDYHLATEGHRVTAQTLLAGPLARQQEVDTAHGQAAPRGPGGTGKREHLSRDGIGYKADL